MMNASKMVNEFFSPYLLASVLLFILALYYQQKRKKLQIKRWQKSLNLTHHSAVFQHLYQRENGFRLSRQARRGQEAIEFTYGEIEFLPFIALLSLVKPDETTIFYDLGSGIGKAVLACAMVYPVKKSIGVEIFPELHLNACEQVKKLALINDYAEQAKKIEFILANFFEVDLHNATLIFINATTFLGSIWEKLCAYVSTLPNINTIITTSKPLIHSEFYHIRQTKIQMSWGIVCVFIHKRKTNLH